MDTRHRGFDGLICPFRDRQPHLASGWAMLDRWLSKGEIWDFSHLQEYGFVLETRPGTAKLSGLAWGKLELHRISYGRVTSATTNTLIYTTRFQSLPITVDVRLQPMCCVCTEECRTWAQWLTLSDKNIDLQLFLSLRPLRNFDWLRVLYQSPIPFPPEL